MSEAVDLRIDVELAEALADVGAGVDGPRGFGEQGRRGNEAAWRTEPLDEVRRPRRVASVRREREDVDTAAAGRPARFFYRLTPRGAEAAWSELTDLAEQISPVPVSVRLRRLQPKGNLA